ncbi:hypothetical protein NBRC116591_24550 [Sessilibacter corallicola]|uniref:Uncharacterized protein n=1 Tax=Sessilibacter corallicola TaxID=2904075 RepID=A0ABQ0AAF9_9GAMM
MRVTNCNVTCKIDSALDSIFTYEKDDDLTVGQNLKDIRFKLETSTFPGYVMLKANELP